MKHFAIIGLLALASCTTADLDRFKGGLNNFVGGVEAVNEAVGKVSVAVAKNCAGIQTTALALAEVTASSRKAGPALAGANAAIRTWCQEPPTDIASAIKATAAEWQAAKAAYQAAKNGG